MSDIVIGKGDGGIGSRGDGSAVDLRLAVAPYLTGPAGMTVIWRTGPMWE